MIIFCKKSQTKVCVIKTVSNVMLFPSLEWSRILGQSYLTKHLGKTVSQDKWTNGADTC